MSFAEFSVFGPHVVRFTGGEHRFAPVNLRSFWKVVDAESRLGVSRMAGCYVFAMRTGRATVPWYVGKTFGALSGEVFAPDKERKYLRVMHGYERATPVWFLVPERRLRGKVNRSQILALERELIRRVQGRNPRLLNKRGLHREEWHIHGYDCGCRGRVPTAAAAFARMLHPE